MLTASNSSLFITSYIERQQRNIAEQASEVYKKFRFTLRFLLGNLHDFDPNSDGVDFEALPLADRYMLHRLGKLLEDVKQSYSSFQFFRTYQVDCHDSFLLSETYQSCK